MTTKKKLTAVALILMSALANADISNQKKYQVKFSKSTISLRSVAAVEKIKKSDKSVSILQTGLRSEANKRITASVGVGKRFLVNENKAIAGVNFFTDYQTESKHRRLGIGLEYARQNFKANYNKYFAISYAKETEGHTENALSGYDLLITGQAPFLPWAKIKTSIYHWQSDNTRNIKGSVVGVNVKITPSLSLEFGQNNSNGLSSHYANLSLKLPYSIHEKYTDFKVASSAFGEPQEMSLSSINFIDRSDDIRFSIAPTPVPPTPVPPTPVPPTPVPKHKFDCSDFEANIFDWKWRRACYPTLEVAPATSKTPAPATSKTPAPAPTPPRKNKPDPNRNNPSTCCNNGGH